MFQANVQVKVVHNHQFRNDKTSKWSKIFLKVSFMLSPLLLCLHPTPCVCFRKAPLEKRDRDNYTPLLMAAYSGHAESLDALLKKGADYEAVDKNDKTAVYLAAEEDKLDALKVI